MRSISRRAGWSTVAKKSGSPTATRSTGICKRANHTRTAAGMRSSVRMLWNSSATISIVARSSGVAAARLSTCLRWCSSSSMTGTEARPSSPRPVSGVSRWRMLACAVSIARPSEGDSARGRVEARKPGTWRPTSRFSRPSTASTWSALRGSAAARVIIRVSSPT